MAYQFGALKLTGSRVISQIGGINSVTSFSSVSLGGDTTFNINFASMNLGSVTETTPSSLIMGGTSILVLSGANSYTGPTIVRNGTLKFGTAAAVPAGPLAVTGGVFDLNGISVAVPSLSSNVDIAHGAGQITNSGAAPATLTFSGNSNFAGNVNDGAAAVGLNVAPGVSLSLSSASNFSGGVAIGKSAQLSVSQPLLGTALGSGAVTLAGGTLALQGQRQIMAAGQQPGLAAQFYNTVPARISNFTLVNPNFVSLGAMNAHLNTLSPALLVQTTTNGKDNFDFSNQNDATQAPFGIAASGTGDTTADYGFTGTSNYEVKFTGYINVPQAGTANFSTTSDDGSAIWIDDGFNPVVSNNFFQGAMTRSGSYNFTTPGLHAITIGYYQAGGGEGLKVSWTPPGGVSHTLLNNEVVTANLGYAPAQTYGNDVAVTADSAIDVSNSLSASLGNLSIGANKLSITSSDSTSSPYSLSLTSLSVNAPGDTLLDVQNSAGGGLGTLTLGPIHGAAGNDLHKTGPGTLAVTGTSDYAGVLFVEGGRVNVTSGAILNNDTQVKAGAILGGLGTINGTVSIFSQGKLAPSFDGAGILGAFHASSVQFSSNPATLDVTLRTPQSGGAQYDSLIYSSSAGGSAELEINDSSYAGPSQPGGLFWIVDGQLGSLPTVGNLDILWQGALLHDGDTFSDANGFTYQINYDAAGDPLGTGHDVLLTVVSTPEPTAASLLMFAAAGLLARRRSRGDRRSDH